LHFSLEKLHFSAHNRFLPQKLHVFDGFLHFNSRNLHFTNFFEFLEFLINFYCTFAVLKISQIMTAVQLYTMNVELWQSIGAIADDESLMKRLTRYAKKLVKEKESDPTLMTKEEFFARVDEAKAEIDAGKGLRFDNVEELDKYIRSL